MDNIPRPYILIVDDEEINLFIIEKMLKDQGAEIHKAANGFEAMKMVDTKPYSLMILDVQMPGMDGFELARHIRDKQQYKYVPILFVSAIFTDNESKLMGYVSGAVDYLTKPVNPTILKSKVSVFLELSRQKIELEHNIEQRKKIEEELRELNTHLEQRIKEEIEKYNNQQQLLIQKSKLESLGEIAAGIAHEINQPLAGISMSVDNITYQFESGNLTEDYFNKKTNLIFEDIKRIKQIIEHVRIFSRDQKSEMMEKLDVNECIGNSLSMVQTQYRNHNIDLNIELKADKYTVGNKFKFEQVLINLLSNARYAVDKKEANFKDPSYRKTIALRSYVKNDFIYVEMEDNGIGISQKNLESIFNPFFTTKEVDRGTGLGLSICYGIIKEMNGTIDVKSKEHSYTILIISLPVLDQE